MSETESYVGSHSAAHSVTDYDDIATLSNKFKTLRRENQQLKTLLRQNELIITQNIEQLKQEKGISLKLCQAILPLIKRFTKPEDSTSSSSQTASAAKKTIIDTLP